MTDMPNPAPAIGRAALAWTIPGHVRVRIEVTSLDVETIGGWYAYGYRLGVRGRPRQTAFPRLYFVPRPA